MEGVVGRREAGLRRSAAAALKPLDSSPPLSLYADPPPGEDLSLEDFETLALDRLAGAGQPPPRACGGRRPA